eukprot:COSAG03_NODE_3360_length_2061_cov_7.008155_2_plen_200_part_00
MQPEGVGESAEASEEDEEPGTEQRPSTPTRGGEQNSSRGVGATSLQKYLRSVVETLTPDEDDEPTESDRQLQAHRPSIGMNELRAEAQSAREVLTMVLNDVQSREKRGASRHAEISRMATSILASVRELREARDTAQRMTKDAATQTDRCEGLAPLAELRIEDEADMLQLVLLTNQVAALAAQDTGATGCSGPCAQQPA